MDLLGLELVRFQDASRSRREKGLGGKGAHLDIH